MAADWVLEAVRYYRRLGFFSQHAALTDEALAERLEALIEEEWGDAFAANAFGTQGENERGEPFSSPDNVPFGELTLLRADPTRVWWEDTEADVCQENRVYVDTLRAWSGISRGAFLPQETTETWESEEGPITVRFTLNGQERILHPEYADDWLDQRILGPINEWIRKSGYAFELYDAFDQTAFVVVLTPDEKRKLAQERGWRFSWPSPPIQPQLQNAPISKWLLFWLLGMGLYGIGYNIAIRVFDVHFSPVALVLLGLPFALPIIIAALIIIVTRMRPH